MDIKLLMITLFVISMLGCKHQHETEVHDDHGKENIQYTIYTSDFELFAEAEPFIAGSSANLLAHFSRLPNFIPLDSSKVIARLQVNETETIQILENSTRPGIYKFTLEPLLAGKGRLVFEISQQGETYILRVPDVVVYRSEAELHENHHDENVSRTNTSVFTKEQSWKVGFSTDNPQVEPFGEVIKTVGQIQSIQKNELILTAKTNGIILFSSGHILNGGSVNKGQELFIIKSSDFADNNITVRYAEAKNNYEKAEMDYSRASSLAQDKIIPEKDLIDAENKYHNAKAVFENLKNNFTTSGQSINCPEKGFIKQVFITNGEYVTPGQPIVTISQNSELLIVADVSQKDASLLNKIYSANIRDMYNEQVYSFGELNGEVLTYGKSTNTSNHLIPVSMQIDNIGNFIPGSYVEVYLKTISNTRALTVPNSSLLEEQGVYYVYVQINPELFEKREVRTGISDGIKTEIIEGLRADERIVTRGAIYIKLAQSTGTLDAHSGHVH
ncbi:MAG: efflux RND transporter periplasmic adaptor subunit [Bacteroidales bacterium]|nr:efflux RND transporter periplasmic adaptor subunit [Bacteroidales bacterium]MCF8402947.1 efflux RND transporter periplasmic adaptor subunit [Bacteroidales bacterium]